MLRWYNATAMSLIVALTPLKVNSNVSMIARTASVAGCNMLITSGNEKLIDKITRWASLNRKNVRTLAPKLKKLKKEGYKIISLELTPQSEDIRDFKFPRKSVIVAGNETTGVPPEILDLSDSVVQIPVYGDPSCYNVAVATSMSIYEYRKQWR